LENAGRHELIKAIFFRGILNRKPFFPLFKLLQIPNKFIFGAKRCLKNSPVGFLGRWTDGFFIFSFKPNMYVKNGEERRMDSAFADGRR
jgi:hypothetical protein